MEYICNFIRVMRALNCSGNFRIELMRYFGFNFVSILRSRSDWLLKTRLPKISIMIGVQRRERNCGPTRNIRKPERNSRFNLTTKTLYGLPDSVTAWKRTLIFSWSKRKGKLFPIPVPGMFFEYSTSDISFLSVKVGEIPSWKIERSELERNGASIYLCLCDIRLIGYKQACKFQ